MMRRKLRRSKPRVTQPESPEARRPRKNAQEPQVLVPQKVDLPLPTSPLDEVRVPASIDGRSLSNGRE